LIGTQISKPPRPVLASNLSSYRSNAGPSVASCPALESACDEDLSHQVGGDAVEVIAAVPAWRGVVHQAHVGLVHERGRLQCGCVPLVEQIVLGEPVQHAVDDWDQLVTGLLVPVRPLAKQPGDVSCVVAHGRPRRVLSTGGTPLDQPEYTRYPEVISSNR
jgi:hypothetical protein